MNRRDFMKRCAWWTALLPAASSVVFGGCGSQAYDLGLFWVSEEARALTEKDDDAVIETVLAELDRMFDGQASRHHVQSMVQNWSAEPFIQGAYSVDFGGSHGAFTGAFAPDKRRRMFFAGEAFGVDHSTVHGAMESAYESVRQMLFA